MTDNYRIAQRSIMNLRPRPYYAYIMASYSRATYVGMTNNLLRRVQEHREEDSGGYCGKWKITKLVYFEEFSTPSDAIDREKLWKGWKRRKKWNLIEAENPEWEDLTGHLSL